MRRLLSLALLALLLPASVSAQAQFVPSSTKPYGQMFEADNAVAYTINDAGGDLQGYHTAGIIGGQLNGFTFDAGGAGTSFPIASIADGLTGEIAVTTTGDHLFAVGDIISHSNLTDPNYVGFFVVNEVTSATIYEVTATWGATGTGTTEEPASLIAGGGTGGVFEAHWSIAATAAVNNDSFDFAIVVQTTREVSTNQRRDFPANTDVGSASGSGLIAVNPGEHVLFCVSNSTPGVGDVTIRDFGLILSQL